MARMRSFHRVLLPPVLWTAACFEPIPSVTTTAGGGPTTGGPATAGGSAGPGTASGSAGATTDATCPASPGDAPVACGENLDCFAPARVCCMTGNGTASCVCPEECPADAGSFECDDSMDCEFGKVCCGVPASMADPPGSFCTDPDTCASTVEAVILCREHGDCMGGTCLPADDVLGPSFPAIYQVCVPPYGPCGPEGTCPGDNEICIGMQGGAGVCGTTCTEPVICPLGPMGWTPPECISQADLGTNSDACVLPCNGGGCPPGMVCTMADGNPQIFLCMWDP